MAVDEEQQPHRGHQHQRDVAQPGPGPGFVQQRALPVELAPRRPQRRRHQRQGQRHQRVAAAQPGRDRQQHAQRQRDQPRRVAAPLQALADQQQQHAAQAAEQVRGLHDRQRRVQRAVPRHRQGAVDHQQRADREHRQRDDLRQPRAQRVPDGAGAAAQRPAHARQPRQQGGEEQRHQVIGDAVGHRGGEQGRGRHLRQQLEQAPLEHAQPGRHGGDQPGHHRHQVQTDEAHEADAVLRRQQHMERGRRQRQFHHAQRGDFQHRAPVGDPHAVFAPAQAVAAAAHRQPHQAEAQQQGDAQQAHGRRVQRQRLRRRARFQPQRQAQQHPGAEHEAQRAHQHHLADLGQAEPGVAVAAYADRAAGERGEAQRLPGGVGEKGGDRHAAGGQAPVGAAQPDRVETDQAAVASHAQQQRQPQLRPRQRMQGAADLPVAVPGELAGQRV